MKKHKVVTPAQWTKARKALLVKEKQFSRLGDKLSQQRRQLPSVKVEKEYVFDGPDGPETLPQLFGKRSQLAVYHFMFAPGWGDGCMHCSFWADHYDSMIAHLNHRDANFVVISRAPMKELEPFKKRMGWKFKWVSSGRTDFNYDFQASFTPEQMASGSVYYNYRKDKPVATDREGASIFCRDESGVYHTYSTYARGIDILNPTYHWIDLLPKGRDEGDSPQSWVRYHDQYRD